MPGIIVMTVVSLGVRQSVMTVVSLGVRQIVMTVVSLGVRQIVMTVVYLGVRQIVMTVVSLGVRHQLAASWAKCVYYHCFVVMSLCVGSVQCVVCLFLFVVSFIT